MSKYTTELRFICETLAGYDASQDERITVNDVIEKARTKIFDFDYPIFDKLYKPTLETKIIKHYYTREICAETYGRWKLFLDERMNLIMPYYNQLYESERLKFDPFNDIDVTTEQENEETAKRNETYGISSETGVTSESWNLYSDTPQGGVNGVKDGKYLSSAEQTTNANTTNYNSGTATSENRNNTGAQKSHTFGKTATHDYNYLLKAYRETFLNIDKEVVEQLSDLFMEIW